jgi:hypothetical protein
MFTINSTKVSGELLLVDATFILSDGTQVDKEVTIHAPTDKDEVLQMLSAQELTEQRKHDFRNSFIKQDMDVANVGKVYEVTDKGLSIKKDYVLGKKKEK